MMSSPCPAAAPGSLVPGRPSPWLPLLPPLGAADSTAAVAAGLDLLDAQLSLVTLDEVIAAANTLRNVKGLT